MGSSVGEYSRQQLNVFRNRVLNTGMILFYSPLLYIN